MSIRAKQVSLHCEIKGSLFRALKTNTYLAGYRIQPLGRLKEPAIYGCPVSFCFIPLAKGPSFAAVDHLYS